MTGSGATALPGRIAFLGLGLIGGSIALALRRAGYRGAIAAWTPGGHGPASAVQGGTVDRAAKSAAEALDGAGLVILAGPPLAILESVSKLAGPWRAHLAENATVTDVGSTKARIVAAADAAALPFVGGHPMAGRETAGFEAATAELFEGRPWVVVPGASARPLDVEAVENLASVAGASPVRLGADEHDAAVAAISHLPLVLAAALVEAVAASPDGAATWPVARALAASGWRDMTRLARGDPDMGAGILATNSRATAARLRDVRDAIEAWLDRLDADAPDADELRERLERARQAAGEPPR